MTEFISSPFFIFVTGVTEVILLVLLVVGLIYVIKILKNLNRVSAIVYSESVKIADDIDEARDDIKEGVKTTKKQLQMLIGALTFKKVINMLMESAGNKKSKK
ncbi:MAG: hypothetical protein WDZ73_01560 [Candidatus Paceibacterota bacterium]